MSDGGAYSSLRSILLVLTHDYIITCVHGPTGGNGHEWKDADAALRTILMPFEAKGVLYAWGPVQPANGPPTRTILPARLVIHRQTSAHERRKGTLSVRWRSDILAHLCTRQHWLWVTVEPHEEAVARKGGRYAPVRRVLESEPLSLRRIDIVVGHGRSGVP